MFAPMTLGYWKAVKWQEGEEGQRRVKLAIANKARKVARAIVILLKTIAQGLFWAAIVCLVTRIPYLGAFLGIVLAFCFGWGIGYLEVPLWRKITMSLVVLFGFYLGLRWQLGGLFGAEALSFIGTGVAVSVLFYGLSQGDCGDTKKDGDEDYVCREH